MSITSPGATIFVCSQQARARAPQRYVVGIVGMLGALGGFFLPPAFGMVGRWSGIPQMAFLVLLALAIWSLVWLHIAVMRMRTDVGGRLTSPARAV